MKDFSQTASCIAIALMGLSAPVAASAQSTAQPAPEAEASGGIADIIVTAERREQNVQKAPLTIQVIGGDDLSKAGITDTASLQKMTSGLQIGANGASTQVFLRGVGSFAAGTLTSPGVAFNVDGIYVGRPEGTSGNFYDIARVEVLKGPQGTLYGRNATGGAINVITNEPRLGARTAEMNFEGGNYNLLHASGAVNLPIGDTAAIRGAFNIINRDGYLSDGQNDDVQQAARLRFKWEPSPDLTLLLNADYSHVGGRGGDYVYLPRRPGASPYESMTTPEANAYMHAFGPGGAVVYDALNDNYSDTTLYNFSAQLDYRMPFATLTIIPAYRYVDANYIIHFTTTLENRSVIKQKTLEVRLGNSSRALTWVLGGYAYRDSSENGTVSVRSAPFMDNLITVTPKSTSYAAFGQATLSLTDGLRLIGGLRYTHEKKSLYGNTFSRVSQSTLYRFDGEQSFNNVSYKVGAEFDLAPNSLLYATYSTGYKSGGFSQIAAPNSYGAEKLRAFEAGVKNRFLNNRVQVNLSGFHWKYKDIQDSRPGFDSAGNLSLITFNSGDATIYGGTADIVLKPTQADTINLSGEYAHSEYDQFAYLTPQGFFNPISTGCAVSGPYAPGAALPMRASGQTVNGGPLPVFLSNCAGFQVARVPKWSGTAAYAHDFTLANGATVTADASVNFASARWLTIDFIDAERDGAYAVVNANLTYSAPGDRWSVGLFGRNLNKAVYYTGGIQSGSVAGLVAANIGAPRTYGIRANFKFGG